MTIFGGFWSHFGMAFERHFEDSDTMGGWGAQGDIERVSRQGFYYFLVTLGLHLWSVL